MKTSKDPVDVKKLSKKYKVDVNKIIHAWKNDRSDSEISSALNIDLFKILQIKQEVENVHMKERLARKLKRKK